MFLTLTHKRQSLRCVFNDVSVYYNKCCMFARVIMNVGGGRRIERWVLHALHCCCMWEKRLKVSWLTFPKPFCLGTSAVQKESLSFARRATKGRFKTANRSDSKKLKAKHKYPLRGFGVLCYYYTPPQPPPHTRAYRFNCFKFNLLLGKSHHNR